MNHSSLAMIAVLGTALGGTAAATDTMQPPSSAQFVQKAGEGGMAEIQASRLAESKAQRPEVQQFAQQMVQDHTQAANELSRIAKEKNMDVPQSVNAEHKAAMAKLKSESGAEFDADYMKLMKKDHDKVVALFNAAGDSSALDPELQAFAKKTLPTLEHHQMMAAQLSMKLASAASDSSKR